MSVQRGAASRRRGRGRPTVIAIRRGRLVLVVLVAHLLLLDGLDRALDALDRVSAPQPSAALRVRTVRSPGPSLQAPAPVAVAATATPIAAAAPHTSAATLPSTAPVSKPSAPVLASAEAATAVTPPVPSAPTLPDVPAVEVPTYRTVVPPPFAYAYDLRRGERTGRAELHWDPQGTRYTARLTGSLDGRPWIAWDSEGAFDVDGLAPQRHTDRRRGRSAQAANFQREAGKVTFSGPSVEHPLAPGAQDGLSWMLQLAAIATADPSLVGPGGRVSLVVVGDRGEADVWTFVHVGEERLSRTDGEVRVVRLLRDARGVHDLQAEVWLDLTDHYLPVRFSISGANGAGEMQFNLINKPIRP